MLRDGVGTNGLFVLTAEASFAPLAYMLAYDCSLDTCFDPRQMRPPLSIPGHSELCTAYFELPRSCELDIHSVSCEVVEMPMEYSFVLGFQLDDPEQ